MNNDLKGKAIWIEGQAEFETMLDDLANQAHIAIDTESNSLYAYQEQVCLIQISTAETDYLVDPLADIDISRMGTLTADPGIEKIFHAAEYDIICLRRDFGFEFAHIFDTMHTARILGFEKVGLANMLLNQLGVVQGRSYQKANWGVRPLDEEMKTYARYDTHFLIALRNQLAEQLAGNFLAPLAWEDFDLLCRSEANGNHRPLYAAVSGFHKLSGAELRVLDELCRWRDKTARQMDRPLFKVVGAKALLEIAQTQPAKEDALKEIKGISPRLVRLQGAEMLAAVRAGQAKPPLYLPKHKRPSNAYMQRLDNLGSWRKQSAKEFKVQSDIILPRTIMEDIAGCAPASRAELAGEMSLVPWRFQQFGSQIMTVLRKGN